MLSESQSDERPISAEITKKRNSSENIWTRHSRVAVQLGHEAAAAGNHVVGTFSPFLSLSGAKVFEWDLNRFVPQIFLEHFNLKGWVSLVPDEGILQPFRETCPSFEHDCIAVDETPEKG